jgi:hypothetical protein
VELNKSGPQNRFEGVQDDCRADWRRRNMFIIYRKILRHSSLDMSSTMSHAKGNFETVAWQVHPSFIYEPWLFPHNLHFKSFKNI